MITTLVLLVLSQTPTAPVACLSTRVKDAIDKFKAESMHSREQLLGMSQTEIPDSIDNQVASSLAVYLEWPSVPISRLRDLNYLGRLTSETKVRQAALQLAYFAAEQVNLTIQHALSAARQQSGLIKGPLLLEEYKHVTMMLEQLNSSLSPCIGQPVPTGH